jgi:hypothetical protein
MRKEIGVVALAAWSLSHLVAQTTQGLISGSLVNSVSGQPVSGAAVTYTSTTLSATGAAKSDAAGTFFLPLLSPGAYTIRATADGYQSQELQQLELAVAGRIQIDFRLRPLNDVWEAGQFRSVFLPGSKTIVTFYGPDVDTSRSGSFEGQQGQRGTLDTSVSYVIDPAQIADLPLQGRDVYTMLVSLPGVTADNGTARGLGVSVAGQRPSSSNYLLDGVENDNYLITGPLNPVAPEAIQEYRISTNNYSAEYGRTSGFIANAVTRAGGNQFHGIGYEYLKNNLLNAADFTDNLNGFGRLADKENQFGYQVGGPILRNRLFFSSALEQLISHSTEDPQTYVLPTTNFIPALNIPSTRLAAQLLTEYPGPTLNSIDLTTNYTVAPPVVVDRLIGLERGDYLANGGRDHLMARLNIARLSEPDFIWTPYPAFISGLHQDTTGIAGGWTHTWTPRLTSELKLSYSDDDLWWNRAHPEIPTLVSADSAGTTLPGSPAFYAYRNHNKSFETIYSTVWTRNRHVISAGVGLLFRFNSGYLTAGQDGEYIFSNLIGFAFDQPQYFRAAIDTLSPVPTQPDFNRSYSYDQSYFFAEDSFRVTARLTLNYGLRYERYGAPQNTGAVKDALIMPGPGNNLNQSLASATPTIPTTGGNERIFGADNGDWAPRFGFSWDPLGKGKTVVRGGFGMFYDRPFDNLWQNVRNNDVVVPEYPVSGTTNYLEPIASVLPSYAGSTSISNFQALTLIDPNLRNGYAETFFFGVQQAIGGNLTIEVNGTGSEGHRLITTDIVNRQFTTTTGDGRPNESLPDISWRSSQGNSDYTALTTLVRYRRPTLQLQAAYTWSHSIDDQSDPLTGDFFDLDFTSAVSNSSGPGVRSSFSQQFNNNGDRGNSDFDQRQNLFLLGIWQPSGSRLVTRDWKFSWMAAFRSGFPYSVLTPITFAIPGDSEVENQRADVIGPAAAFSTNQAASGGRILLNSAAFAQPVNGSIDGNTGRNEFTGPGLYNIDLSVARSFAVPKLREGTRLTIRADAFNFLNHANLNNPDSLLGSPTFGLATYGRQGTASGFPAVSPVNETARQIQMLLRLEF